MTQAQALLTQAQTDVQALQQARALNHDALTLLVGEPIAAIRKEGKFTSYDAALAEARRRQPELFS